MDLINVSKEELKILSEKLNNLKKYGATEETIKDALLCIVPNNIGIDIKNNKEAAYFDLNEEKICISVNGISQMINDSNKTLLKYFPKVDSKEMFNYYVLFSLIHETRHSYQYLISENKIQFPYEIIKQVYNEISYIGQLKVGFLKNVRSLYLYNKYRERLVIERNANIEATEIISKLAKHEENQEIHELFNILRHNNILYGYENQFNGSIEETYKTLGLDNIYNLLPVHEQIPIKDRILYGLPIDYETKKKVLEYKY